MTPEELSAYASVATLLVTVVITIILQRWSNRVARAEHERSIREWWNSLNVTALASDDTLVAADRLMNPAAVGEPIEEKRRRWFAFLVLNALSSSYLGARDGLSRSEADTVGIVKHHLNILLASEDIYRQSQAGYEPDFAALCREVHAELLAKRDAESQSAQPPTKTN